MPYFTTDFAVPPTPGAVTATPDPDTSYVVLSWLDSSPTLSASLFFAWVIYRSIEGGPFLRIGAVKAQATRTFTDEEAPVGSSLTYRVTQHNGSLESAGSEVETQVLSPTGQRDWYWVTPGRGDLTFRMQTVTEEFPEEAEVQSTVHNTRGRSEPVIVEREIQADTATVGMTIEPYDRDQIDLMLAAQRAVNRGEVAYQVIKTGLEDVYRGRVGTIQRVTGNFGRTRVTFPVWNTEPVADYVLTA